MRYWARIEYLRNGGAFVELADECGAWAGSFRVSLGRAVPPTRRNLYEEGYRTASREAALKGGELDRYSEAG